jgi:localization factor PodJL
VNCIMCRPFAWVRKHVPGPCIADRPEVQAKFESWRYAQTNDREVLGCDPECEAVQAATKLSRTDPAAAFLKLLTLAERGSVWSMLCVAWAYATGAGTTPEASEAERWYRLAFERGCQQAQLRLGNIYRRRADFDECEKIYGVGAADHWAPAMYHLAMIKLRQPRTPACLETARSLLEQASALGDVGAQWALGRRMGRGLFGLRRIPRGIRLAFDACEKTLALVAADSPGDHPENRELISSTIGSGQWVSSAG